MKTRLRQPEAERTGSGRKGGPSMRNATPEQRELVTKAMYGDEKDALEALNTLIAEAPAERVAWVVKNCENEAVAFKGLDYLIERNELDELGFVGQFAGFKSVRDKTIEFIKQSAMQRPGHSKYISLIAEHTRYEDTQDDAIRTLLEIGDFHRMTSVVKYAERESARLAAFEHLKASGELDKIRHLAEVCEDPGIRQKSIDALTQKGEIEPIASVAKNGRFLDSAITAFDYVYGNPDVSTEFVAEIAGTAHMRKVQLRGVEKLEGDLFQIAKIYRMTRERVTKDACSRILGDKEPADITKALCTVNDVNEKDKRVMMAGASLLVEKLAEQQEKELLLKVQEESSVKEISDLARLKVYELENPDNETSTGSDWMTSSGPGFATASA